LPPAVAVGSGLNDETRPPDNRAAASWSSAFRLPAAYPNGVLSSSPGLHAAGGLPWVDRQMSDFQTQRGCVSCGATVDATPLGLRSRLGHRTQSRPPAGGQPLALGRNAVGVERLLFPALTQRSPSSAADPWAKEETPSGYGGMNAHSGLNGETPLGGNGRACEVGSR
jgi:hypothetical protein